MFKFKPQKTQLMITLDALSVAKNTSSSSSSSLDVKITSLSGEIAGNFGPFRTVTINDKTYTVDAKRVKNTMLFTPNCDAVLTLNQYTKNDEVKTIIAELSIKPKQGCGFFVMQ